MENEAGELIIKIIKKLSKKYPNVSTDLTHKSPFELLIATILSAQCTDKRVNMVTPELFSKYPNPSALASATLEDVEKIIYSTGFYKNKAKNIINCANELMTKHLGKVPSKIEELTGLSGVGRKTANCVMGYYFKAEGIVVDTHVIRITNLLGIVKTKDAEKIERKLMEIIPKKYWVNFTHYLIKYGREICVARHPKCSECEIKKYCRTFIN
jgi:endonuclease-3